MPDPLPTSMRAAVFSATNYCNVQHNDGAMLHVMDIGSAWRILPKYIDEDQRVDAAGTPLTPAGRWLNLANRPPTPVRGPHPGLVAGGGGGGGNNAGASASAVASGDSGDSGAGVWANHDLF
jgi:hypothetical protein